MEKLLSFLSSVEDDPKITTAHISLYVVLWKKWRDSGAEGPLSFFRSDIEAQCKMGMKRYHSALRELHEYGYIKYEPSNSKKRRNLVYFIMR